MTSEYGPVALDAMGGDKAPQAAIEGAVAAHRQGCRVILVGDEGILTEELRRIGEAPLLDDGLELIHAPEVIGMGENPAGAIRAKRGASVSVCAELVASGRCSGMVSAGSTGAAVAAAVLKMGRIKGVERPGIATLITFPNHPVVLIDSGANPECKATHLGQFGVMGALFARHALKIAEPRVGLLNIGEEAAKGAALHKEAHALLAKRAGRLEEIDAVIDASGSEATFYRFVGNVEGYHMPMGAADVVVTDGFTGNVVLKLAEGTARAVIYELLAVLSEGRDSRAMEELAKDFAEVKRRLNPEGAGGAYLLGVEGNCVIAHGAADARAIQYAIEFASDPAAAGLVEIMKGAFRGLKIVDEGQRSAASQETATATAGAGA